MKTHAHLLVTRPRLQGAAWIEKHRHALPQAVNIIPSPLLSIEPLGGDVDLGDVVAVIFTSANGVAHVKPVAGRLAYCVGSKTTAAAAAHGWDARQCGKTADDLVESVLAERPLGRLLHICGLHTRGAVAERLTKLGIETKTAIVYQQTGCALTKDAQQALSGELPVIVPLFSPRSAAHFVGTARADAPVHIVAISQNTAQEVQNMVVESLIIASEPTGDAVFCSVQNALRWVER